MMTLAPFRNAAVVGLIRRWQLQMLQLHFESLKCCASLIQILIPSHAIQLGQNHRMLWNIGHKVMYVLCVLFAVLFRFSTFPRISIPPCPFRHCELKYLISLRLPHTHSKKNAGTKTERYPAFIIHWKEKEKDAAEGAGNAKELEKEKHLCGFPYIVWKPTSALLWHDFCIVKCFVLFCPKSLLASWRGRIPKGAHSWITITKLLIISEMSLWHHVLSALHFPAERSDTHFL